jgi:hypothetical protein
MKIYTVSCFAFILISCDVKTSDPDLDFRSDSTDSTTDTGEPIEFWDEIRCTWGTASRCYGHRSTATELWSPVVSACDLQRRVDFEGWEMVNIGWTAACDPDGVPQAFPEQLCFHPGSFTIVVCFGGADGWYTEVGPACDAGPFTSDAWPSGSCDLDGKFGYHEYDHVFANPTGPAWLGRAFDAGDHFVVVPECAVGAGVIGANPFSC